MKETAKKILQRTSELIAKSGTDKISMDQIAANADVTKVTVYKHFGSRSGLMEALAEDLTDRHLSKLRAVASGSLPFRRRLRLVLQEMTAFTDDGRMTVCRVLDPHTDCLRRYSAALRDVLVQLIREGQTAGQIRSGNHVEDLYHYINMSYAYYQNNEEYRSLMQYNQDFRNRFMKLLLSQVFVNPAQMLQVGENLIEEYCDLAREGTRDSVGVLMSKINPHMTLSESKFLDFALGHIESEEGMSTMRDFLYKGTPVQRNYCALFFNRAGEYEVVSDAYRQGLIDAKQAFSR